MFHKKYLMCVRQEFGNMDRVESSKDFFQRYTFHAKNEVEFSTCRKKKKIFPKIHFFQKMKQKSKKSKRYVLRKCFESSQKKFGGCTTKITDCSLFRATLGIC